MISLFCFWLIIATFFFRYYLLCQILETGYQFKKKDCYIFFIIICFLYFFQMHHNTIMCLNLSIPLILITYALLSSNRITETMWKYGLIFIGTSSLDCFFEDITTLLYPSLRKDNSLWLYFLFVFFTTLVIIFLCIYKKKHKDKQLPSYFHGQVFFALTSIFIGTCLCISAALVSTASEHLAPTRHNFYFGISCFSMLAASLLCEQVYHSIILNRRLYEISNSEKLLREAQEYYYKMMLDKEEETRKFRHDYNNHIMCINALLSAGKNDELKKYLDDLQNTNNSFTRKEYSVGNTILDAITNYYAGILPSEVSFSVTGTVPEHLAIHNTDLSIIYSNLLKNAIEEIQELRTLTKEKLSIRVTLRSGKKFWQMEITNSTNTTLKQNDLPKTRKKDTHQHGIGLRNVKKACERYAGTLQIRTENSIFIATVVLPLQ